MSKTSKSSSPGPDGISYRLLKLIRDTDLGKAILNDIALTVTGTHTPLAWRALSMVMIPKPGKDHSKVKGWRPIVLANTVGKLGEKLIADELQSQLQLFHNLQYGSRKGRSAIDSMMLTVSHAERAIKEGKKATLLGKDIVSTFNNVRKPRLMQLLRQGDTPKHLISYIQHFLTTRTFQLGWDGLTRGEAKMDEGTPQGSPLSPVIWLIYIAGTLSKATYAINQQLTSTRTRPATRQQQTHTPNIPATPIVKIFSYVDDINPLVISNGSIRGHNRIESI